MRTHRITAVGAAVLGGMAALSAGAPAQAHEGHTSCREYGMAVVEFAQVDRPFGQLVSGAAKEGINDMLVREGHSLAEFCVQR